MSRRDEGGFVSRWSRRKRAATEAAALPQPDPENAGRSSYDAEPSPGEGLPPADAGQPGAPERQSPPLTEEEIAALPDPASITASTDITPFLREGVPAALRNAALRRAWLADPAIAGHADPARDYFWDWNTPGGVPGHGGRIASAAASRMAEAVRGADAPPKGEAAPAEPPAIAETAPRQMSEAAEDRLPETDVEPAPPAEPRDPVPPAAASEGRATESPAPSDDPAQAAATTRSPAGAARHGSASPRWSQS